MFAIIRTRWHTRPLSRRAKRRSSAAPGSLRKKYAGIVHPPNMVRSLINSTTSGDHWKPVLFVTGHRTVAHNSAPTRNQSQPRDQKKPQNHFAETGFIKPGI